MVKWLEKPKPGSALSRALPLIFHPCTYVSHESRRPRHPQPCHPRGQFTHVTVRSLTSDDVFLHRLFELYPSGMGWPVYPNSCCALGPVPGLRVACVWLV